MSRAASVREGSLICDEEAVASGAEGILRVWAAGDGRAARQRPRRDGGRVSPRESFVKSDPLPAAVRSLISERIDSVGELEALLLLRAHPGRAWTAGATAAELRTGEAGARGHLLSLHQRGLLAREGEAFRFTAGGEAGDAVAALAVAYVSFPVAVVSLIYAKPNRAARSFADAFRLRRYEEGEAGNGGEGRG